ncbi:MAG: thioesterase [Oscillospiraceae bacterium]|nr:thioesterase [Oscillospiraceae bacterium]
MEHHEVWFPFSNADDADPDAVMVFCFHHAGGSAAVYKKWTALNDRNIVFIPVELPAKGCRIEEEPVCDMKLLTDLLADAVENFADGRRFVFYGHSMGAAVAFKTAHTMQVSCTVKPELLIVSGRHSPCISIIDRYTTDMDDSMLVKELEVMGGTPKEILENKEIMQFLIPKIKNDYKLNESFVYQGEVLDIPIEAYAGSNDFDASFDMLDDWESVTTCGVIKREFQGEHFFPFDLHPWYESELKTHIRHYMQKYVRR